MMLIWSNQKKSSFVLSRLCSSPSESHIVMSYYFDSCFLMCCLRLGRPDVVGRSTRQVRKYGRNNQYAQTWRGLHKRNWSAPVPSLIKSRCVASSFLSAQSECAWRCEDRKSRLWNFFSNGYPFWWTNASVNSNALLPRKINLCYCKKHSDLPNWLVCEFHWIESIWLFQKCIKKNKC